MINPHKGHFVLGRYCWNCRRPAAAGIPGWPIAHNGDFTRYSPWVKNAEGEGYTESIVWANGDSDTHRATYKPCRLCNKFCGHPVSEGVSNNNDSYREVYKSRIK